MNDTPRANRVHIGFFGRRNTGKSSLVNAVTGQDTAVVSDIKGTTTDPVLKAMELLPVGPVLIIDTPGIDDEGDLGELRIRRTRQMLNKTDIAVLVIDAEVSPDGTLASCEEELVNIFKTKNIPYIVTHNKTDLAPIAHSPLPIAGIPVSAKTGFNINMLKEKIAFLASKWDTTKPLVADLIRPLDFVFLVIPLDKAAPRGRLILPQQQVIRDILEAGAVTVAVIDSKLKETLECFSDDKFCKKPSLVITDSQIFSKVCTEVPDDIPLTSFSIIFARYKGFLETSVRGVKQLDSLQNDDKILICEGCTHHRQCEDIGTVKIPLWIKEYSGKTPEFIFLSGGDFPENLSPYKIIIHCGGCMLNDREMTYRSLCAEDQNIPFTNYGITIAYIQGILERSIAVFKN